MERRNNEEIIGYFDYTIKVLQAVSMYLIGLKESLGLEKKMNLGGFNLNFEEDFSRATLSISDDIQIVFPLFLEGVFEVLRNDEKFVMNSDFFSGNPKVRLLIPEIYKHIKTLESVPQIKEQMETHPKTKSVILNTGQSVTALFR